MSTTAEFHRIEGNHCMCDVILKHLAIVKEQYNMLGENLQTVRGNTEIFMKAYKDISLEVNFK